MAGESKGFFVCTNVCCKGAALKVLIGLLHPKTTYEYQLLSRVAIAKAPVAATPSIRHDD